MVQNMYEYDGSKIGKVVVTSSVEIVIRASLFCRYIVQAYGIFCPTQKQIISTRISHVRTLDDDSCKQKKCQKCVFGAAKRTDLVLMNQRSGVLRKKCHPSFDLLTSTHSMCIPSNCARNQEYWKTSASRVHIRVVGTFVTFFRYLRRTFISICRCT